jgi:hypothetical protein
VSREQQLEWEARWGRPAGVAAIVSALLFLASGVILVPEQREGVESYPADLLAIDEHPGAFMASIATSSLAMLLILGPLLYLFRAAQARGAGIPPWFRYLVVMGPVLVAAGQVVNAFEALDVAEEFASGGVIRGEAGDERAADLNDLSPVLQVLPYVGLFLVGISFVMVALRARVVGLLSPFMGVLGVIVGVITFADLLQVGPVLRAFWLGAVGLLLIGSWPGGRGPAWESGEAEPWPTAAQRRGLAPMPGEEPQLDPEARPEPEPVPERPASRKRRRKRR